MKRLLIILALVIAAACLATPAQARYFAFRCSANQDLQVDPIVSPGVYPSAHLHTFYAARGVTQDSTLATLEASPGTSCGTGVFFDNTSQHPLSAASIAANTAGIWLPTMQINGVNKNPQWVTDYWSNTSAPKGTTITDAPEGLQMIAASSAALSPPPEYELYWDCGADFSNIIPSSTHPQSCPTTGPGLLAHIEFPTCWNGAGLSRSDIIYAGAPVPFTGPPHNYPCPAGYRTIPHIQLILHTGVHGNPSGLTFSSGAYYTLHADYFQSWHDQTKLASLETFLRTGATP